MEGENLVNQSIMLQLNTCLPIIVGKLVSYPAIRTIFPQPNTPQCFLDVLKQLGVVVTPWIEILILLSLHFNL